MFLGYWPFMYQFSKSVRPLGCFFATVGYYVAWSQVVNPFLTSRFQAGLNSSVSEYAKKYQIKSDAEYLK